MQVRIPKINPKACLIYKSLLCFCFPVSSVMFLWLTHTSRIVCSASCPAPHAPQLQRKCLENRFSYPPPSECNVALERLRAPPTMCMCAIRTCMCIAVACALTLHPHAGRSCICRAQLHLQPVRNNLFLTLPQDSYPKHKMGTSALLSITS
jgi:hypothetical protein